MSDAKRIVFANWQIKHNGEHYQANQPIKLTDAEYDELMPTGAVRDPIDGDTVPAEFSELTDEKKLDAVVAAFGELNLEEGSDDMTKESGPKTDAIERIVDFDVSADMRDRAWALFNKDQE